MLGVTYKTAWFMSHRIRESMRPAECGFRRLRPGIPVERGHAFRLKAATCSDEGGRGVVAGVSI
jgi:hypothetical protein